MDIEKLIQDAEENTKEEFKKLDELEKYYSEKVLEAFNYERVSQNDFLGTSGYGFGDEGRDKLERIYTRIFGSEDSLVRSQMISGTHALTTAFFSVLRPNDKLISISGKPYDTLDEVIGYHRENPSSLKSFGILYEEIDLIDDDFDYEKIEEKLKLEKPKMITIQRSIGYSTRKAINYSKLEKVISLIKKLSPKTIVMIDNCYCEFTEFKNPIDAKADLVVGSLIKNLGGGIAPNGGYITGRKDLIELAAERLGVPGEGKDVGPSLDINKSLYMGLYHAPSAVIASLKTGVIISYILEKLGYKVSPKYNEERIDIVSSIYLEDEDKLIKFVQGVQKGSAIDSYVLPIPYQMPGYDENIIMASGSFVSGSSIEVSCDGPIKKPYIAYFQGSLTYQYGRYAIKKALENLLN